MPPDYSVRNLRGRSFKGQNLTGVNFSDADIRGADFSSALLRDANFSFAKAGLQRRWVIFLIIISLLLAILSGLISAFAGVLSGFILTSQSIVGYNTALIFLIIFAFFFIITIRQGLGAALGIVAVAVAVAVVFSIVSSGTLAVPVTLSLPVAIALAMAVAVVGTVAVALAAAVVGVSAVIGTVILALGFAVTVAIAVAGASAGGFLAAAIAGSFVFLGGYIGWQALKGDEKNVWVRSFAIAFAATKGTSFRNADLTNANFTQATLKSTDFRKAILIRTCFHQAKKLDRVRPGSTYLQKAQLLRVLVTGEGQEKNFDRQDLRGVNFKEANLVDASFLAANLSEANLQDAYLYRVKLVQTQLDGTDFTGATLTGAYIEDWGITSDTKFDGVKCEYVYMRLPTKENPDPLRKPDNNKEVFADGEFSDFIKPIIDTLDLYHNQGVDPRAIAISFKHLAENHPDAELEIVAIEKRGQDKLLLRVETAPSTDKSELSAEYFTHYNHLKALPEKEIRLLIAEKSNRIRNLETMIETALQRPSFYTETYQNQGNNMSVSNYQLENISDIIGGDISSTYFDNISAVVTHSINNLPDSFKFNQSGIKKLLIQLKTVIETDSNLSEEDKFEALEQVKELAELGQNPESEDVKRPAKIAIRLLRSTQTGLSSTSKIVESFNQLLTAIADFFGLKI